jgi:hypothetical protein
MVGKYHKTPIYGGNFRYSGFLKSFLQRYTLVIIKEKVAQASGLCHREQPRAAVPHFLLCALCVFARNIFSGLA